MSNRFIYTPKERNSSLLRISSMLFSAATVALWFLGRYIGLSTGDLLIMSGISVLLLSCSLNGKRAEKKAREQSEIIRQMREECGKGDYNNDIFYN